MRHFLVAMPSRTTIVPHEFESKNRGALPMLEQQDDLMHFTSLKARSSAVHRLATLQRRMEGKAS
jgi:hypothetical protein